MSRQSRVTFRKYGVDLQPGDRLQMRLGKNHAPEPVTVIATVESVQTIRRPMLLVTLRDANGKDHHRTYNRLHTFPILAPQEGDSDS